MARVIVVDDHADIRHLVLTCLSMHGHDVKLAASKKELLHFFEFFGPELVILDVNLGGENGRDICKEIKTTTYHHVPVILYSANVQALFNYQECEANDILEKPFEIKTLIEKVNNALKK